MHDVFRQHGAERVRNARLSIFFLFFQFSAHAKPCALEAPDLKICDKVFVYMSAMYALLVSCLDIPVSAHCLSVELSNASYEICFFVPIGHMIAFAASRRSKP